MTKEATRSRCSALISGPISVASSRGSPTLTLSTASPNRARNSSWTERSTRIRERAQQSWPALSNTAYGAVAAAFSRSASANTTLALLPPSSRVSRLTCPAHVAAISLPTSVEPVNTILPRRGARPAGRPPPARPGQDLEHPLGQAGGQRQLGHPQGGQRRHSAGLTITVLPAASAGAMPQVMMTIGKFHGTITPTTPSGSLKVTSSPPGTGICRPWLRSGAPA